MSRFTIDAIDDAIKHATDVARRKYVEGMLYHANSDDEKLDDCIKCGREHEQLAEWLEELKCYKDLEDQLEKLYGNRLSLDKVVENLNRIVQNGEEKLDYARILTNAEAEKWGKWKDLEEQGRLIELPCEKVYRIMNFDSPKYAFIDSIPIVMMPIYDLKHIDNGNIFFSTKEKAEAKLKEMEGAEWVV